MRKVVSLLLIALVVLSNTLSSQNEIYQLPNGGFELWDSNESNAADNEPTYWNGFKNADCTLSIGCSSAKKTSHSKDTTVREGATGSYCLRLFSRTVVIAVANGTMTTGRLKVGSMTATDTEKNYTFTDPNQTDYRQYFHGRPDSLVFWAKLNIRPKHSAKDDSTARFSAVLHTDAQYNDPPSGATGRVGYAALDFGKTTNDNLWHRYSIPFIYDNPTTVPSYILITLSTNTKPSGGTAGDEVFFDDIEMIYLPRLAAIQVDGENIADFDSIVTDYYYPGVFCLADIPAVTATKGDTAQTLIITEPSLQNRYAAITVSRNGDSKTYRVHFNIFNETPVFTNTSRCGAGSITLLADDVTPGDTCRWYASEDAATPFHVGNSYTTPVLDESTTYYVSTYRSSDCESDRVAVTATINLVPEAPVMKDTTICPGTSVTLSPVLEAGYTYTWFTSETETEPFFTGDEFTGTFTQDTVFYVRAMETATGCTSNATSVSVSMHEIAELVISGDTVCANETVTLSVTNTGLTILWFESLDAEDTLHIGNSYTLPSTESTVIYLQSIDSTTSCQSDRIAKTVVVVPEIADPVFTIEPICDTTILAITKADGMLYLHNHAISTETENTLSLYFTENEMSTITITDEHQVCSRILGNEITVKNSWHTKDTITYCESYFWGDSTYTESGNYTHVFTASNGCDSTVTLNLTLNNTIPVTIYENACETYEWNDSTYTVSGTYEQSFTLENGCDSVVTLHLTIGHPVTHGFSVTRCGNYTWNDSTYTVSGDYVKTFTTPNGCDSTVTLTLVVNPIYDTTIVIAACGSHSWNDSTYTESGNYTHTFETVNGCDSTVTIALTINPVYAIQITDSTETGVAYNKYGFNIENPEARTYTLDLETEAGCDSIITLHLSIISGINDYDATANVKLYPNPTNSQVTITSDLIITQIDIYSATGKLVAKRQVNDYNVEHNVSSFTPGVYMIRIYTENGVSMRKLIVN
ncbi:T9SS type A sorting domain-containing protein [Bacteroidales bacterium OttesenSCG-928-C03]|nr:T9SS type A sorting domain-containing protein [Bacteroidales bacterium OttesenSCG-928-C03]MDL2325889.1 T9SS type A sorting domain-containing protein [Bacteroidales bacterium OttesenSCG-928-A14]